MSNITVWASDSSAKIHQLSDRPSDGNSADQIAYLSTLDVFSGYSCVSEDYSGPIPETDASLWRWDGEKIIAVTPVPVSVTPRQVRLLLLQKNLLDQVEAMIAQQDKATQITWNYALEFRRDDPLLAALAQNLGLSAQQVDGFFIEASNL